ncbi:NAD-dependent epimerase/dehydratase family protein [Streptomyces sp. CAS3]
MPDDFPFAALRRRTVLVTGGSSLSGHRIVARCREIGARVISLCAFNDYPMSVYRSVFRINPRSPDVVFGDITDDHLMQSLVARCDYVVHADMPTVFADPKTAVNAHVLGTQTLLEAVATASHIRRLVFLSSASVYGNGESAIWATLDPKTRALHRALEFVYGHSIPCFPENSPLLPLSVHANAKAWGERQTELTLAPVGVSYTIVRCFDVYGEPQVTQKDSDPWEVAWFTACAAAGLPLQLNSDHPIRDLVHVDDIAEGTLRALVSPAAHQETINIGTGIPTPVRRVALLVHRHYPHAIIQETPLPPSYLLGGYASTQHMEQVLGWKPQTSVENGIARYVQWLERTPHAIPEWLRQKAADQQRMNLGNHGRSP